MLEGARVPMKVVESVRTKEGVIQRGYKSTLFLNEFLLFYFEFEFYAEFTTFGEDPDFTFEIKETDIVTKDKDTSNVTGIMEGETTVSILQISITKKYNFHAKILTQNFKEILPKFCLWNDLEKLLIL